MSVAKFAAALRAAADALEAEIEEAATAVESAVTPKKAVKAIKSSQPAATPAAPAAQAPAAEQPPAQSPAAPTTTLAKLNTIVRAVAGKDRDGALAILGQFGVNNTGLLKAEQYDAAYDAFEEAKAKQDAQSVQSLV
jgi:hypothetical protein